MRGKALIRDASATNCDRRTCALSVIKAKKMKIRKALITDSVIVMQLQVGKQVITYIHPFILKILLRCYGPRKHVHMIYEIISCHSCQILISSFITFLKSFLVNSDS